MADNLFAAPRQMLPEPRDRSESSGPWLGRAQGISLLVLLLVFSVLTWSVVDTHLDAGPEHLSSVIRTTACVVLGPMTGAISRGATSGCCLENSLTLLAWTLPIVSGTVVTQWLWRPRHGGLRFLRLLIWCAGWLAWFFSGLLSLGHALS